MILKKREILMIILLLVVIEAGSYYFLFFQSIMSHITQLSFAVVRKENEITEAKIRGEKYQIFLQERDETEALWEEVMEGIPSLEVVGFNESDLLRRYQQVIFPHTGEVNISFPSNGTINGLTVMYPVNMNFTVTYEQLMTILNEFNDRKLANRIVNYSYTRVVDNETRNILLNVNLQVDYLNRW